jgi:hypothetical protein
VFLQVFRCQVDDTDAAHGSLDRWMGTLDGTSDGWLGTTAGVTPGGDSLTLTRFASEEDARRTNEGPAGDAWRTEMAALSPAPLSVQDCSEVLTQLRGDTTDAGFVQVLQGRIADLERLERALEVASPWEAGARPDIIGGLLALHGDGGFTQTVYFTSEAEARDGERAQAPSETAEIGDLVGDLAFFDLPQPWAYAPR